MTWCSDFDNDHLIWANGRDMHPKLREDIEQEMEKRGLVK